jgi:Flp pilus assembly pilin Flp
MNRRRHTPNFRDPSGQTMTEYAFILALIFAVVFVAVPMIGTSVANFFTAFAGAF